MRMIPVTKSFPVVLSGLLLTGCMNLAPVYEKPESSVPAAFAINLNGNLEGVTQLTWDDVIVSEDLRALIRLALEKNQDIRLAAANIELARAQYGISRAGRLPTVNGTASVTEGDTFGGNNPLARSTFSDSSRANIQVSAFELDFFSRVKNGREADLQAWLATVEGKRAAEISIASSVAQLWVRLASDIEVLKLAQQTIEVQGESLSLTRELLEAGAATELDVRRASTSVETARAQAAVSKAQILQDLNALRLVVGADLPADIREKARLTPEPVLLNAPAALKSDILVNRPDVLQAERNLMAANANIGAARAAFCPTISLTGSAGYVSGDLGELFDGGGGWSFGPSLSVPIFNAGALDEQLKASEAQRELALAQYEQTIQTAFRETSDALAVASTINERLNALLQLEEDTGVTLQLSEERFKVGVDDYLSVLDAQQTSFDARQQVIAARADRALNQIALFQAIGVTSAK